MCKENEELRYKRAAKEAERVSVVFLARTIGIIERLTYDAYTECKERRIFRKFYGK